MTEPMKEWRRARGPVITDDPRREDTVKQDGIDWDQFLHRGFLYVHDLGSYSIEDVVGMPVKIEQGEVEGHQATIVTFAIRPDMEVAVTAHDGRVGLHGAIKERQGDLLTKVTAVDVFLTENPADPHARIEFLDV